MSRQVVTLKQAIEARPWLTERFLRRLVLERRIPFHKLGDGRNARLAFDLADIDEFAEKGRVEPPAPIRLVGARRATGSSRR